MTPTELFATAARLHDNGTEYALVSVVRAEAPTSARPGDKALVTGTAQSTAGLEAAARNQRSSKRCV